MIITLKQKGSKVGYPLTLIINTDKKIYDIGICLSHSCNFKVTTTEIYNFEKELQFNEYVKVNSQNPDIKFFQER